MMPGHASRSQGDRTQPKVRPGPAASAAPEITQRAVLYLDCAHEDVTVMRKSEAVQCQLGVLQ